MSSPAPVSTPDSLHSLGVTPSVRATQSTLELPGVRLVANGPEPTDDLTAALDRLRTLADPVLVDTAAGASPAVADPLRAADATIVVSTPTQQSLEDAAKTAAMARTLDAPVVGSVITRSDGSVDPRRLLDCPTLAHVPPVSAPSSTNVFGPRTRTYVTLYPSGIFNQLRNGENSRHG